MKFLITGGAGFIGRWAAKEAVKQGHRVWILDDLSNSSEENIAEFRKDLAGFVKGDIKNKEILKKLFINNFDVCIHMAAKARVQESIDDPAATFNNDVIGSFNLLEEARKANTKVIFTSSALVYCPALNGAISEEHPVRPSCPYTAYKLSVEKIALSYYYTYNLPIVITRPFSAYGPFQKDNQEGGVVSIFIRNFLDNKPLPVWGDGAQSRDFFFVEDCAKFLLKTATAKKAEGKVLNAGSGRDVRIKDLALFICKREARLKFVPHLHPKAEVQKMMCDYSNAERVLGWRPQVGLEEGISITKEWLKNVYKKQ